MLESDDFFGASDLAGSLALLLFAAGATGEEGSESRDRFDDPPDA